MLNGITGRNLIEMLRLREISVLSGSGRIPLACGVVVGLCIGILVFHVWIKSQHNQTSEDKDNQPSGISESLPDSPSIVSNELNCLELFQNANSLIWNKNRIDQLAGLDHDETIELLRRCAQVEPSIRAIEAQELLLGRLAQSHPASALREVWNFPRSKWNNHLEIVFGEWSVLDTKGALSAANDLNEPFRTTTLRSIFDDLDILFDKELDEIVTEIGLESFLHNQRRNEEIRQYLPHPRKAWEMVIGDDIQDDEQEELLVQIAESWIQEGDFEVLDYLLEDVLDIDHQMFDRILASTVHFDEVRAFEHGLTLLPDQQRRLIPRLIKLWSLRDSEGAFIATSHIKTSSIRRRAQVQTIQTWAKKNPQKLLDNIQTLPRQLQQESVLYVVRTISESSPERAAEEIRHMRSILGSIDAQTEYLLVREWSKTDPHEALKWVKENADPGTEKRSRMMQRILTYYALVDPVEAMAVARSEEPHSFHGLVGLESEVIDSLANSGKLDTAITLLEQVRESARSSSFISIGERLIGSKRTSEAIELSRQLSEEEQLEYYRHITDDWLSTSPANLLENISTLPSKLIQSVVAETILNRYDHSRVSLTTDQLVYVRSFLHQ